MKIVSNIAWFFYLADEVLESNKDTSKSGKWMFFFDYKNVDFASDMCARAVEENVVKTCKHSNPDGAIMSPYGGNQGVACFYCDYDDNEAHKRILKFFIDNNLIRKTKAGKLYNISFKLDEQTDNGEYGATYDGTIKLEQFVDLSSGQLKKYSEV